MHSYYYKCDHTHLSNEITFDKLDLLASKISIFVLHIFENALIQIYLTTLMPFSWSHCLYCNQYFQLFRLWKRCSCRLCFECVQLPAPFRRNAMCLYIFTKWAEAVDWLKTVCFDKVTVASFDFEILSRCEQGDPMTKVCVICKVENLPTEPDKGNWNRVLWVLNMRIKWGRTADCGNTTLTSFTRPNGTALKKRLTTKQQQ